VVYYDQRGCGKSEKSNCYTWREHIQDLKRVIRTFSKGKKVILAGSSWGTSLALLYAYALPEDIKAIILSGTFQWWGNGNVDRSCYYYTQRTLLKKDTFHYRSLKYGFEIPSSTVANKSLMEKIIKEQKILEIHTVSRAIALKSLHDAPGLNDLEKIKVPILIFKGTGVCDAKNQMLQQIKDGANQFTGVLQKLEVYTITEACHDPWFTHTEEFFAKSIEFLERVK
jgi:pimeloyl-ACP methyl ester carboxylesterase